MNKTLFLSVVACFLAGATFIGCKKDKNSDTSNSITSITAKVEDGERLNGIVDEVWAIIYYDDLNKMEIIEEAKYSNAGFKIDLPSNVNAACLMPVGEVFEWLQNELEIIDLDMNISISDKTAKFGVITLEGHDDTDSYVGIFSYENFDERQTMTSYSLVVAAAIYWYVDKNVTITASHSDSGIYEGVRYSETVNFNLPLKKGWNGVYLLIEISARASGNSSATASLKLNTVEPTGLKWVFHDNFDDFDWDFFLKSTLKENQRTIFHEKFQIYSKINEILFSQK